MIGAEQGNSGSLMVAVKKSGCLWRGVMPMLAGLCVLLDGLAPAAAQGQTAPPRSPPAPRHFPTYPIEGPYGPYSDLIPSSGQL